MEAPGTLARIRYHAPTGRDGIDEVLAFAEQLVAVDAEGWDAWAEAMEAHPRFYDHIRN